MSKTIKEMVQKRITYAWGWLPDEPEAVILAENVEFVAKLLVVGTLTTPESLISALVNGPEWGQRELLAEWDKAARPDFAGFHNGGGFALDNWKRIKRVLESVS